ncbi:MAG: hypothetical protein IJP31_05720 [Lachnospiraceae bacterium]|nr:hypothetical protein [Lachnospiraceae bacterium]
MIREKKKTDITSAAILFIFSVLAVIWSVVYIYIAKNKGYLWDKHIIFYVGIWLGSCFLTFCFLLTALVYGVKKGREETGRLIYAVPGGILLVAVLVANLFFHEMDRSQFNYYRYRDRRKEIVEEIQQGKLAIENGSVLLPYEYTEEAENGMGQVSLIHTKKGTGIYFCSSPTLYDSTSGYVYLTDRLPENASFESWGSVILFKEYEDGWYSCATSD